jgi:hypothetical protein
VSRSEWSTSKAELLQPFPGRVEGGGVVEEQRGVRLAGRTEGLLHAHVHLDAHVAEGVVGTEPRASATRQGRGLGDLGQAEAHGPEAARGVLAPGRAGDLHVVEPHAAPPTRATTKIRRNGRTTP